MERDINILAISDVHVGCPRIDPVLLHQRLIKYFYPHITPETDILFICGDFFDSLLSLNSVASLEAVDIIRELRTLCAANHCDLRVLRGTYTHDRDQPRHFVKGIDPSDTSVRLYSSVDLEYHEATGLRILYIPDNVGSKDIYEDIRKLLEAHGTDKADILIHHGYFKHMLPANLQEPPGCLDVDRISKYVKGCVLNGHVHLSSIYKNVISVGSFERMVHNEESPKGFFKVKIDKAGAYHFEFVENKEANKFLSFDMRTFGTMASEAIAFFTRRWDDCIKTFRPDEQVRVRFISEDPGIVEGCSAVAVEKWPKTTVDKVNVVKREQILENVNTSIEDLPVITKDNLGEMLLPIVQKKNPEISLQDINDVLELCKDPKKE